MDGNNPKFTPKSGKGFKREYPFPIIKDDSVGLNQKDPTWKCMEGHLQEDCVLVHDEESIKLLYRKGFFGKGTFSKNAPQICSDELTDKKSEDEFERQESPGPSRDLSDEEIICVEDLSNERQHQQESPGPSRDLSDEEIICVEDLRNERPSSVIDLTELEDLDIGPPKPKDSQDLDIGPPKPKDSQDLDIGPPNIGIGPPTYWYAKPEYSQDLELVYDSSSIDSSAKEAESLQLTFQEAFFLSYGLGCLIVKDKDQPLNLLRLWNKLCGLSTDENFPIMYAAYHHLRSKGWIVRCGLKYGVDYVLYKDGPPFYHASYSVVVKHVKEKGLKEVRGGREFTWSSLAALTRINKQAGKELLFLYVIEPKQVNDGKVSTPSCIFQFTIEEVLINRWVPGENREENV